MGETPTIADVCLVPQLYNARRFGLDLGPYPTLLRVEAACEAMEAFHLLARTEGILAALESSHAVAMAIKQAQRMPKDAMILCNLSGRGDKDIYTIARREGISL